MLQRFVNVEGTIYNRGYISMLENPTEKDGIMEETDGFVKAELA